MTEKIEWKTHVGEGPTKREGTGMLEYQEVCPPFVTSLMTMFCVHLEMHQPQTGAVWPVRAGGMDRPSRTKCQNHTLMGHSPPASHAGRRVGPSL